MKPAGEHVCAQRAPAAVGLRTRWLTLLAEMLDTHMRSPAFLDAMRSLLEAANLAQSLQNAGATALDRWAGARELWHGERKLRTPRDHHG